MSTEIVQANGQGFENSKPFASISAFENAQRMAKALADSDLIPASYKGKVANVLIAMEYAASFGQNTSPLQVMQNLNIINGKPSPASPFLIALVASSGKFSPLRYEEGEEGYITYNQKKIINKTCRAYATDLATNEVLYGPKISMEMAAGEGWLKNPKWTTMPEVMLTYRAASFWTRKHAGHITMGMHSEEEVADWGKVKSADTPLVKQINEQVAKPKPIKVTPQPTELGEVIVPVSADEPLPSNEPAPTFTESENDFPEGEPQDF